MPKNTNNQQTSHFDPSFSADENRLQTAFEEAGIITPTKTRLTVIGGSTDPTVLKRKHWSEFDDVPPWPKVKWCKVPSPPFVDPDWSDEKKIVFMWLTWRNALEYRLEKVLWKFRRHKVKKGKTTVISDPFEKNREILLEAANLMVEFKIQPAPWVLFAYYQWDSMTSKPKKTDTAQSRSKRSRKRKAKSSSTPPLDWAFSRDRVEKFRGWFLSASADYGLEGKKIFTPQHKKLVYDHHQMRQALEQLVDPTTAEIDEVIDRYFPTNYNAVLKKVQNEIDAIHTSLQKRAIDGEWIWG